MGIQEKTRPKAYTAGSMTALGRLGRNKWVQAPRVETRSKTRGSEEAHAQTATVRGAERKGESKGHKELARKGRAPEAGGGGSGTVINGD